MAIGDAKVRRASRAWKESVTARDTSPVIVSRGKLLSAPCMALDAVLRLHRLIMRDKQQERIKIQGF